MNAVVLLHHLGLGDHFICNGLVRAYLASHSIERCFLPCKIHNLPTVQFMYRDLATLSVLPVRDFGDVKYFQPILNYPIVKAGFEKTRLPDWDVSFYDCLGIAFDHRWDSFVIQREREAEQGLCQRLNPDGADYALIHNESSQGVYPLRIDTELPRIRVSRDQTNNLFDYCKLIEGAAEIHCIDSSFVHLVESIGTRAACFFHQARKGGCDGFRKRLDWRAVPY